MMGTLVVNGLTNGLTLFFAMFFPDVFRGSKGNFGKKRLIKLSFRNLEEKDFIKKTYQIPVPNAFQKKFTKNFK